LSFLQNLKGLLQEAATEYKSLFKTISDREAEIESLNEEISELKDVAEEKENSLQEMKLLVATLQEERDKVLNENKAFENEVLTLKQALQILDQEAVVRQKGTHHLIYLIVLPVFVGNH